MKAGSQQQFPLYMISYGFLAKPVGVNWQNAAQQ